jgi:hypothetical protein
MALTLANRVDFNLGSINGVKGEITFDASYDPGGETGLNPSAVGLGSFDFVVVHPAAGYTFSFDYTNNKVLAYRTGAINTPQEEVPGAVNLSAVSTRFFAIGGP